MCFRSLNPWFSCWMLLALLACQAQLPDRKYRCDTDAACMPELPYCVRLPPEGERVCSSSRPPARDAGEPEEMRDGGGLSDGNGAGIGPLAERNPDAGSTVDASSMPEPPATSGTAAPETVLLREATVYIKADSAQAQRRFGASLALRGDLLVVGAPYEDIAETTVRYPPQRPARASEDRRDSGAAYIYRRIDGQWTLEACLAVPNDVDAHFARSVAIDEAGARVVVGVAHFGSLTERVYSYGRDPQGRWVSRWSRGLVNPPGAAGFGAAVAIHDNVLVVSAPDEAEPAVYVYALASDGNASTRPVRLTAPYAEGSRFGEAIALRGDVLVVGAQYYESGPGERDDQGRIDTGAAFLFRRDAATGQWSTTATPLLSPMPDSYDNTGSAVAIDDHYVAVGATGAQPWLNGTWDPTREDEGVVHLFRVETGAHQATVRPNSDGEPFGRMGHSVALDGKRLLAGAPGFHESHRGAGKAYVFQHGAWDKPAVVLSPSQSDPGDGFGAAVGVSGGWVVVGSSREDGSAIGIGGDAGDDTSEDNGAAYAFALDTP